MWPIHYWTKPHIFITLICLIHPPWAHQRIRLCGNISIIEPYPQHPGQTGPQWEEKWKWDTQRFYHFVTMSIKWNHCSLYHITQLHKLHRSLGGQSEALFARFGPHWTLTHTEPVHDDDGSISAKCIPHSQGFRVGCSLEPSRNRSSITDDRRPTGSGYIFAKYIPAAIASNHNRSHIKYCNENVHFIGSRRNTTMDRMLHFGMDKFCVVL